MTMASYSRHQIAERQLVWNTRDGRFGEQEIIKQKVPGFIKGPLPLSWMQRAMALPGKTIHVALALWFLSGLKCDKTVKLSGKIVRSFGVSRDAKYDALKRLEAENLIKICRKPGSVPVVTLLDHTADID
jgi:hypothetical protein